MTNIRKSIHFYQVFLMREASFKRVCLSVCVPVCLSVRHTFYTYLLRFYVQRTPSESMSENVKITRAETMSQNFRHIFVSKSFQRTNM